jgi:4-diphosphocytidyl-2-C-methyl-D-erythritol kinase
MSAGGAPGEDRVAIAAPAKLNLALLVGPVRPDGFHEIASLMVPVSLADLVMVEKTPGAGLDVACNVAPGGDNLAAKMVRELEQRLDRSFEVRVTIEKRVPAGAGLGGGSSDAAATLFALERLYGLELSTRVRYEAAAAVGSDVPFFLWPGPQLAMGRGQALKDVELPALRLVVAMPDLGLSTAAVYRWHDADAEVTLKEFVPRARLLSGGIQGATTVKDVAALVANDLEPSVVARKPQVGELIGRLRGAGALAAAMTGSGAACFGIFASEAAALRARDAVAPARAWYVTDLQPAAPRTAGRSPAEAGRTPVGGNGHGPGRGEPPA